MELEAARQREDAEKREAARRRHGHDALARQTAKQRSQREHVPVGGSRTKLAAGSQRLLRCAVLCCAAATAGIPEHGQAAAHSPQPPPVPELPAESGFSSGGVEWNLLTSAAAEWSGMALTGFRSGGVGGTNFLRYDLPLHEGWSADTGGDRSFVAWYKGMQMHDRSSASQCLLTSRFCT